MRRMNTFVSCSTSVAVILLLSTPFYVSAAALEMNGDVSVSGTLSAGTFSGSGALITNIPGSAIAGTSITVNQIADGAVTPVKIGFLGKVAIVAASGGDYDNPAIAMGSYADWCGTPSETNRCLLKIMPGVYDVGTSPVIMQPYIDIEGSGENTTVIQGTIDIASTGIVNGASNTELRFLTVKNNGTGGNLAYAIFNLNVNAVKITNVTATASGAASNYGIVSSGSTPTLLNVTATATGGTGSYAVINGGGSSATMINVKATAETIAVYNSGSSAMLENVRATATGTNPQGNICAVNNYGNAGTQYTVTIRNSILDSNVYVISNQDNFDTRVANTTLRGLMLYNAVAVKCMGVSNSSYTIYYTTNACPLITY
jgi:hypothetical protein